MRSLRSQAAPRATLYRGKTEFQNLTAQITRLGSLVSGLGQSLNQHFAVALNDQLVS